MCNARISHEKWVDDHGGMHKEIVDIKVIFSIKQLDLLDYGEREIPDRSLEKWDTSFYL